MSKPSGHLITLLESQKTNNGETMYEHIKKLVYRITKNETKLKGYDHFEILSQLLKDTEFIQNELHISKELKQEVSLVKTPAWLSKKEQLFTQAKATSEALQGKIIPDITSDFKLFEQAGISFGEEEIYKLDKSLKQLALHFNPRTIRFWGKIFGLEHDYFVIEGNLKGDYADEVPLRTEPKGLGVNRQTFWVTTDLLDPWVELPIISPDQVNIARKVKYAFTGDLNRKVQSYPVFPGLEKHFLKAQIVRISNSSVLAPSGMYKINDENDKEIDFEDEFKMQEFSELSNLANWVHLNPNILMAGRVTHFEDMTLNEEDRTAQLEELNNNDPVIERLKGISEDKPAEPFETNWLVRTYGETINHNQIGRDADNGTVCYATHVIKNLTWPGAFCFVQQNKYCNIYIGYGMKNQQQLFFPLAPSTIQTETQDQTEHPEPNGKDPRIVAAEEEAERQKKLKEEQENKEQEQQEQQEQEEEG